MLVISATNNILGPLHSQHLPLGFLVSSCLPATPAAYTWYPLYTLYKRPVLATISPLTLSSLHDAGVCCPHCGNHAVSTVHCVHLSISSCCVHLSIPSCVHLRHSALTGTRTRLLCCAARRPAASRHQQQTAHLACGRGLMRIEIHRE